MANTLRRFPFKNCCLNRVFCKNPINNEKSYLNENQLKPNDISFILSEKSILKRDYKSDQLILLRMFSSGSSLDDARKGTLTVDLVHDRHTEHYFKHLDVEASTGNSSPTPIDEANYDEDDCYTFNLHFAPRGWVDSMHASVFIVHKYIDMSYLT